MRGLTRRKALGGGIALLSLALSATLVFSLLLANAAISTAQTTLHDKVAVKKVAAQSTINAGDTASFTITVTTQPFPIDGVVLTDVLPTGLTWTVSGADAVAAGCAGTYAGGSTLVCNFGNLGDFGVVVTKTVTISGRTSAANCPSITNRAHVDAAPSEGETDLSNNDSSATITVVCAQPTATATPVPPPSAKIAPTNTTCQQFRDGTASTLGGVEYSVRSNGRIGQVDPGIFFYFVGVNGPGTYHLTQSDTGSTPAFGVQNLKVYTRSNCNTYSNFTVNASNPTDVVVTISGAAGTQFIIQLGADPNTVVGSAAPSPSTVVYTYSTGGVAGSTQQINLVRKV